MNLSAT